MDSKLAGAVCRKRKGMEQAAYCTGQLLKICSAKQTFGRSLTWSCHCESNDCILNGWQVQGV